MAGASPTPQTEGRKSLDAEINLVPFIDLLSVCICFLLMTAVWIQIGAVQVKQSHGTAASAAAGPYELDLKFSSPSAFQVAIKKGTKTVKQAAFKADDLAVNLTQFDLQLGQWIAGLAKGAKPEEAKALISAAMVTPKSGVVYGTLVAAMDVLRQHEIANLGVVPVREGN
jgi:biopolymer transport protein TolR